MKKKLSSYHMKNKLSKLLSKPIIKRLSIHLQHVVYADLIGQLGKISVLSNFNLKTLRSTTLPHNRCSNQFYTRNTQKYPTLSNVYLARYHQKLKTMYTLGNIK